jgi:hypothetical protein
VKTFCSMAAILTDQALMKVMRKRLHTAENASNASQSGNYNNRTPANKAFKRRPI